MDRQQFIRKTFPCFQVRALLAILFLALVTLSGCIQPVRPSARQAPLTSACQRVVSLSPSITEVLYALDLGDRVAGVTRYCKYPKAAQAKPQVGGYVDPDTEALLRLQPDLVILREEQIQLSHQLKALGFPLLAVDHQTVPGILASIEAVGQVCHRETQARALHQQLQAQINQIAAILKQATRRPTVLVVLDRNVQSEKLKWAFVAGEDGFYNQLVENAEGRNVLPKGKKGFLQISAEGILRLNPDVIIETTESLGPAHGTLSQAQQNAMAEAQWRSLPQVSAVKHHRVYHFGQDYMVIPGPRFPQILKRFAEAIHPELHWEHE
ncbi:ABC transporter substrate-binding protein [Vampirovibrio chlorellavorus]|uniref:ABC transporter substrate-binding protein n=1 Tax=Vampirovibrio chlorellavorus TaxID=758823 RepID=UPI0026ECBE17|nr:helical backbone metal receptor [Vampirovibrio chlorellavorus]